MFSEVGVVNSAQVLASSNSSKIKQETQENFVKTDSVVTSDETFFSPVIKIDRENQTAILQFRDKETGEVTKEYPSESVRAYEPVEREEPVVVETIEEPVEREEIQPRQDVLV